MYRPVASVPAARRPREYRLWQSGRCIKFARRLVRIDLKRRSGIASIRSIVIAGSPAGRALRVHVERIDRVARRHEQAVALGPTEADIGRALGQRDEANRLAGGIED